MEIRPTYLIMVTDQNNNKFYNCFPDGDRFRVEYGRINQSSTTAYYPISKWESQINSKLRKGYKDVTDLKTDLTDGKNTKDPYKQIEVDSIRNVINNLQKEARNTVRRNYTVSTSAVTQAMIDAAQHELDCLSVVSTQASVERFNNALLNIFSIIPRSMGKVQTYLAATRADFDRIIVREQDLLDAMRSQVASVSIPIVSEAEASEKTVLEAFGLCMREASVSEIEMIKKRMGSQSFKFKQVWRVTNLETQERFERFVLDNDIKKTKLLWHGSRTENFWSILRTGLKIRPTNAVLTGSMFGNAIYTSPSCSKSIGYTSIQGSVWAGGSSNKAYIALFDVAYGIPYDVYAFDSKYYNLDFRRLQGYKQGATCLHAHSDKGMLRKDEICVYKEEQVTIKYLVEIGL